MNALLYELGVSFYNTAAELQETDPQKAYEAMKVATVIFLPLFEEGYPEKLLAEKSYIFCNRLRLKLGIPKEDFFLFKEPN